MKINFPKDSFTNLIHVKNRLRAHYHLWLLLALSLFGNRAAFDSSLWPDNDTLFTLQMFYGFYTNFFFHHELARWLPFASYGIQADFWQLTYLSPASYFMGLLGSILRVEDALRLFKLTILLEHGILITGTYLLSQKIFRHKTTRFFVCLGLSASTLWLFQIFWNFRLFYLMPLIFYWMLTFFCDRKPHGLWLAGITFIMAQLGVPVYFWALQILIVIIFFIFLSFRHPSAFSCLLKRSKKNVFFLALMIFLAFTTFYFAYHMLDYIESSAIGRTAADYTVDLEQFLTYSPGVPLIGTHKFLGLFFGDFKNLVSTLYIGILPLIFLLYAFIRVRHFMFWVFTTLFFFLAFFSAGDATFLARSVYLLFPPIRLFRYIGALNALLRLFLILAAGFGLDHFLTAVKIKENRSGTATPHNTLFFCGILILITMVLLINFRPDPRLFFSTRPAFYFLSIIMSLIAVLLLLSPLRRARTLGIIAVFFLSLDLFSYQNLSFVSWPQKLKNLPSDVRNVYPFRFQQKRTLPSRFPVSNPRAKHAYELIKSTRHILHKEFHTFMLVDSCLPLFQNYHLAKNVHQLIQLRFNPHYQIAKKSAALLYYLEKENYRVFKTRVEAIKNQIAAGKLKVPWTFDLLFHDNIFSDYLVLQNMMGCSVPKLRSVSDVRIVRHSEEAWDQILKVDGETIIQVGPPETDKAQISSSPPLQTAAIQVEKFSFNQLELTLDVKDPQGTWLYYADAYHPDWKAWMDGQEVPIARANIAFKAIWVKPGQHRIRFAYFGGLRGIAAYLLAVSGILFTGLLLGMMILFPFRNDKVSITNSCEEQYP